MTIDVPLFSRPFVFLRHGETESNARSIVTGLLDVPLSARGEAQAHAAAATLKDSAVTAIFASPLRRALVTAEVIAEALALPVTRIADLRERGWGVMEGQPRANRKRDSLPAGAESYEAYARRVLRGLAVIPPAGVPLIVAHSGVYRVLCRTLGLPEASEAVANATPVRFLPPTTSASAWQISIQRGEPPS